MTITRKVDDGDGCSGDILKLSCIDDFSDKVAEMRRKLDAGEYDDPLPSQPSALPVALATAGLLMAGSERKVSRRGLLGFGWLKR